MSDFIEINLLPIEDRKIKRDLTFLLDTKVVMPTFTLIFVFLFCFFKAEFDSKKIEQQESIVVQLNTDIQNRMKVRNSIKKLDKILREKAAKNNSLQSIRFNKQLWVRILEGLNKALPANTWIETITQTKEKEQILKLQGSTHLFSEVAFYMIELERNNFFESIELESVKLKKTPKNSVFEFSLVINVNLGLGANNPVTVAENSAS